jgi:hypothetical protein
MVGGVCDDLEQHTSNSVKRHLLRSSALRRLPLDSIREVAKDNEEVDSRYLFLP